MKTESFVFRHKGVPVMPVGIQAHNSSAYSVRELKNAFQAGSGPDLFNLPSEEISTLLGSGFLDEIDIEAIGYESEVDLFSEYI